MADLQAADLRAASQAIRSGAQMKLKIHKDGDTRTLPARPKDFRELESIAYEVFGIAIPERPKYLLKFHDDDNDLVTLTTDREYMAAFAIASTQQRNYLKIFIVAKDRTGQMGQVMFGQNNAASLFAFPSRRAE